MRKFKIATIALLTGTALCLCALLVLLLARGAGGEVEGGAQGESFGFRAVLEKEVAPEGIHSLKIDYGMTFNDVYFYQGEGNNIVIREYMNFSPKEKQISSVEEEDGVLLVKGKKRRFGFFFTWGQDAYTEVYLPAGFAEKLEGVSVKTVSGEIKSEISFSVGEAFSLSSTSGDISIPEIKAGEVQVSLTSGNLYITGGNLAEQTAISTVSGDVHIGRQEGDVKISGTSGNISLDGAAGDVNVTTVSGDITLGTVEGDTDVSCTSGVVRLQKGLGDFDGDTVSGDVWIGALEGDFHINTTSGRISLSGGSGRGEAETISGDMEISLAELREALTMSTTSGNVEVSLGKLRGDITVSSTSGDVGLQIPGTASLALDFESTSGGCSTFFDDRLQFNKRGNQAEGEFGGGEYEVHVSTTSGELEIREY